MKKILLSIIFLFSVSMADSVLLVKKGWQLIGSSTKLEDMSKFDSTAVEEVWHFDAETQKWLGYSPNSAIQTKMSEKNISKLNSLQNWHGFWVKSKKEWALTLKNSSLNSTPADENSAKDIIQLKEGWNLISLPVDTVVSADIFKGMTVWKYNPNQEWELFDTEQSTEDFPRLGHIKNSDGIWVKAPKDTNISIMDEASKLHNFASKEEMESYIKEMAMINHRPHCGIEPLYFEGRGAADTNDTTMDSVAIPESTTGADSSNRGIKNATGTNLQESGVDEADIVKHDGTNIFYRGKTNNQYSHVNVTTFDELVKGNKNSIETIVFNDNRNIESMYLVNNRLVVLSSASGNYKEEIDAPTNGEVAVPYPDYDISQILVDIFDVSDIANIRNVSSYKIDGYEVTSRVVGDNLYLVSSFSPQINIKYPKKYIALSPICQEYFGDDEARYYIEEYDYNRYASCYDIYKDYESNRYYREDYENPIVEVQDLLPEIEKAGRREALITHDKLFASSKENQSSSMTTISRISISTGTYKQSNSFIGYSSTQYASSNALYLVSNQYPIYYDFNNYKEQSSIYKFNLDNTLSYRGIGSVYGHTINQFALSEHQDILRIATTEGFSWNASGTNNSIYTLKEQDGLLLIQGVLSGLGEEGETIKSVRFIGDKAYMVTFRQTDPLYTIDMSNPLAPKKMGELHVNGYSAYMHPVGEDRLLGIGRDADSDGRTKGIKIELFDVANLAHPSSLDSIILSDNTYSEIESNHKALAYRSSDNLFAFPYRQYQEYDIVDEGVPMDIEVPITTNNTETNTNTSTATTNDSEESSMPYESNERNYLGIYRIEENALVKYTPINNPDNDGWGSHRGVIFDKNETTYISFFGDNSVVTEEFNRTVE